MECEHKQSYRMRAWTRDRCYVTEAHQLYWMMTKCKHINKKGRDWGRTQTNTRQSQRESEWIREKMARDAYNIEYFGYFGTFFVINSLFSATIPLDSV